MELNETTDENGNICESILEFYGCYFPNKKDLEMNKDKLTELDSDTNTANQRSRRINKRKIQENDNFFRTPILITAYYNQGDIENFLTTPTNFNKITTKLLMTWGRDLADALIFLRRKNIVHRDIAARNVMLTTTNSTSTNSESDLEQISYHVKLIDFGLARQIQNSEEDKNYRTKSEDIRLPMPYLALECLIDQVFSHESDIWAFGICMWEIFTFCKHKRLYAKEIGAQWENTAAHEKWNLLIKELNKGLRLSKPKQLNKNFYKEIKKCWERNPEDRISAKELKNLFDTALLNPEIYNMPIELDPNNELLHQRKNQELNSFQKSVRDARNFQKQHKKLSCCLILFVGGLVLLVILMFGTVMSKLEDQTDATLQNQPVLPQPNLVTDKPIIATEILEVTETILEDKQDGVEEVEIETLSTLQPILPQIDEIQATQPVKVTETTAKPVTEANEIMVDLEEVTIPDVTEVNPKIVWNVNNLAHLDDSDGTEKSAGKNSSDIYDQLDNAFGDDIDEMPENKSLINPDLNVIQTGEETDAENQPLSQSETLVPELSNI